MERKGLLPSLIDSAPIMEFPPRVFELPASFRPRLKRVVSLEEYISAKIPEAAATLGFTAELPPSDIKDLYQLTDSERKKIALATYDKYPDRNSALAILGRGTYTYQEQIQQIKRGTELGQYLISMVINHINFLIGLAQAGKLRLATDLTPAKPVEAPPFDF